MKFYIKPLIVLILVQLLTIAGCDEDVVGTEDRNQSPKADIDVSGTLKVNYDITFNAAKSSDPDGNIAAYLWDFDDGTTSDKLTCTKKYSSSGSYTITLTITDNDGKTGSASKVIEVAANKQPIAKFKHTTPAYINEHIKFDASESYDSDGTITRYSWSFGDQSSSSKKVEYKRYTSPGTRRATLTVYDNDGASRSVSTNIEVKQRGTTSDCGAFGGHYILSPYRWSGSTVSMKITSSFANMDPAWSNINTNSALFAMAEWHWNSDACLSFKYYTSVYTGLGDKKDGHNSVSAGYVDGSGGTLAYCRYWYHTDNNQRFETDVVIDSSEPWGVNGESGRYDLISVLTHEFGHIWCLNDLYNSAAYYETMYGYGSKGNTYQRSLYCGDRRGIQSLYGYCERMLTGQDDEFSDDLLEAAPPMPTITVSSEI